MSGRILVGPVSETRTGEHELTTIASASRPDSDAHGTVQNGPDIIGQHRTFSDIFSDMLPDMIGHRTGQ